jgi:hypothetical protein
MTTAYLPSLAELTTVGLTRASWWLSVARVLDALDDRLVSEMQLDTASAGAVSQAVRREPRLAAQARRLASECADLRHDVGRVRLHVITGAGRRSAVGAVVADLVSLAAKERDYRDRTSSVVWDAYNQDIGGSG